MSLRQGRVIEFTNRQKNRRRSVIKRSSENARQKNVSENVQRPERRSKSRAGRECKGKGLDQSASSSIA
jgi:hypothetical protein